jgi:light-regulated signal transduction histidine kinase (bacteriophytochrome)
VGGRLDDLMTPRIQSFGFLLALSRAWVVVRVSANLEEMLGVNPAAALGAALDAFAYAESLHEIRNRMTGLSAAGGTERLDGVSLINGRAPFDIAIHAAEIECIARGLAALSPDEVFVSDNFSSLRPQFPIASADVAGVLCIPVSLAAGVYIMLFRREQLEDIRWAGVPHKATSRDAQRCGEQRKAHDSLLAELTVSKPYDREGLQSAIALTLARAAG